MKLTRFLQACIQSKLGYEYIKLFWKMFFSYEEIHIEKEVNNYLMYKHWTPEEKKNYKEIVSFAIETCKKDFGKEHLKVQDHMSWDFYADYVLTQLLYNKFEGKLPYVYTLNKGSWLFPKSVSLSEDGTSITVKTEGATTILTIKNSLTINGRETKSFIDDWTCFKLISEGNKELMA